MQSKPEQTRSSHAAAVETSDEAFASRVETASSEFERKATALINLLTRRGDDLLSSMTAAASESARKVAMLNGDLDAGVERTDVSLRNMERKFSALLAVIDKRGDELTAGRHGGPDTNSLRDEMFKSPDSEELPSEKVEETVWKDVDAILVRLDNVIAKERDAVDKLLARVHKQVG